MEHAIRPDEQGKILTGLVFVTRARSGDIEDSLRVLDQGVQCRVLIGRNRAFLTKSPARFLRKTRTVGTTQTSNRYEGFRHAD